VFGLQPACTHDPHVDAAVPTQASKRPLCSVIADNRETADGLHSPLTNAGIATRMAPACATSARYAMVPAALLLFPDVYGDSEFARAAGR
jgi:hypothetical protein